MWLSPRLACYRELKAMPNCQLGSVSHVLAHFALPALAPVMPPNLEIIADGQLLLSMVPDRRRAERHNHVYIRESTGTVRP
jgi:hypothetical protein